MNIARENNVCKIIMIINVVAIAVTLILGIKGISTFQIINMVSCGLIAWILFRGTTKDKEIFIGIYGVLGLYQGVGLVFSETPGLIGTIITIMIFLGYATIVAYLMKWFDKENIVFVAAIVISVLRLYNIVSVVSAYNNLNAALGNLGGSLGKSWFTMVGKSSLIVITYVVPALSFALLLKTKAIDMSE